MNSLEWINDIINLYRKEIKRLEKSIKSTLPIHEKAIESLTRNCEEIKKELKTLQQIKDILEAWEAINKTFKIGVEEHISEIYITGKDYNGNDRTVWGYSKEGTPKVKKALEVKDKGENK